MAINNDIGTYALQRIYHDDDNDLLTDTAEWYMWLGLIGLAVFGLLMAPRPRWAFSDMQLLTLSLVCTGGELTL
jgi:hypothetical protein